MAQAGVAGTYFFWGVMPLYWNFLPPMPAYEIVLHRMVWTTICSFLVVAYRGQLAATLALFTDKKNMPVVLGCAFLMLGNHLIYIWALTSNQVLEASLGLFLTPILQMGFGIVIFKDGTTRLQKTAIALALAGVAVQVALLGKLPLAALGTALTFAAYTALKKAANYGPGPGLFWETAIIAPLAAIAIIWLELDGLGHFNSALAVIMLVFTGPITTFPLLWFSFGTKHLSLVVVGLLQYLTPVMTLLLGIFYFKEEIGTGQLLSFAFIFSALFMYTFETAKNFHMAERMARRHRLGKLQKLRKKRQKHHKIPRFKV